MTDISNLFKQDDAVFDLEIKGRDPESGKMVDTGVVFSVRSLHNDDSAKIVRDKRNAVFGKAMREKSEVADQDIGELMLMAATDPSDEQIATCVTGWNWGGQTYGKLSTKFSYDNVLAILKDAPWIKSQVLQRALSITDFTKA